jgi:hypothetical protein
MSDHITCKQAVDYISRKEEKKLSNTQRFRLWKHLASCSLCRIFSVQNKLIAKAYNQQQQHTMEGLSPAAKKEILEAILKEGNTDPIR